jgi:hypothetical protein
MMPGSLVGWYPVWFGHKGNVKRRWCGGVLQVHVLDTEGSDLQVWGITKLKCQYAMVGVG